jgi:predicted  nucleic acid-binding Zn-ribbon protein
MINFKELLQQTLADNQMESLVPSREYTEDELTYMRGYNDALNDMLEDFLAEYNEFQKEIFTPSLN